MEQTERAKRTLKMWTTGEDAFLTKYAGKIERKEMAERMGRTVSSVNARMRRLGLSGDSEQTMAEQLEEAQREARNARAKVKARDRRIEILETRADALERVLEGRDKNELEEEILSLRAENARLRETARKLRSKYVNCRTLLVEERRRKEDAENGKR